jgi:hypothetical protein
VVQTATVHYVFAQPGLHQLQVSAMDKDLLSGPFSAAWGVTRGRGFC